MTEVSTSVVSAGDALTALTVTTDARRLAMRVVAVLWLAGLLLGAVLMLPGMLRYERSSSLTWLDGKVTEDFEHAVTKAHPYRDPAVNAWAAFELQLFGEGRPGVIIGRDGWLFTREEFPPRSALTTVRAQNVRHIVSVVRQLEADGLQVLVLPVPAKAEMYPEQVPAALAARRIPASSLIEPLRAAGVKVVDVRPALRAAMAAGTRTYFRTETHWTPEGAAAVAGAVAAELRPLGYAESAAFVTRQTGVRTLASDLENFLPLAPYHAALLPVPEQYYVYRTESTAGADSAEALFGTASRRVALVGTSYSADERWHFANWLRQRLGTDIDNVSLKAEGPFKPMATFLARRRAGELAPELVIWEIPVRSIAVDYDRMAALAKHN